MMEDVAPGRDASGDEARGATVEATSRFEKGTAGSGKRPRSAHDVGDSHCVSWGGVLDSPINAVGHDWCLTGDQIRFLKNRLNREGLTVLQVYTGRSALQEWARDALPRATMAPPCGINRYRLQELVKWGRIQGVGLLLGSQTHTRQLTWQGTAGTEPLGDLVAVIEHDSVGEVVVMAAVGPHLMRKGARRTGGVWSHLPQWQVQGEYWKVGRTHYAVGRPPPLPDVLERYCRRTAGEENAGSECHHTGLNMQCDPDDPMAQPSNQEIPQCCLPRTQVTRTPSGNWGVKTLEDLRKGQVVLHYAGEAIGAAEALSRYTTHMEAGTVLYLLELTDTVTVDAKTICTEARFLDHHCQSNLLCKEQWMGGDSPEPLLCFVAKRNVPAGTFLSFHYRCNKKRPKDTQGTWPFVCDCRSHNCVHRHLHAGDKKRKEVPAGKSKSAGTKKQKQAGPSPPPPGCCWSCASHSTEGTRCRHCHRWTCWACDGICPHIMPTHGPHLKECIDCLGAQQHTATVVDRGMHLINRLLSLPRTKRGYVTQMVYDWMNGSLWAQPHVRTKINGRLMELTELQMAMKNPGPDSIQPFEALHYNFP